MNDLIIRQASKYDASAVYGLLCIIAKLHKNGRPDMFPDLISKYTPEQVTERLSKQDSGVFVAEHKGKVAGYVFCDVITDGDGTTLYIDDLCVDPSLRRLGIGKKLLDQATLYGKEKQCRFCLLNVWEFNTSAVEFYENYGFTTRTRHLEMKI